MLPVSLRRVEKTKAFVRIILTEIRESSAQSKYPLPGAGHTGLVPLLGGRCLSGYWSTDNGEGMSSSNRSQKEVVCSQGGQSKSLMMSQGQEDRVSGGGGNKQAQNKPNGRLRTKSKRIHSQGCIDSYSPLGCFFISQGF